MQLDILYQDEWLVAINKPSGLLVHRTPLARGEKYFAMQLLRDQLGGEHVFPLHRLDRPTSGVLLFARSSEAAARLMPLFAEGEIDRLVFGGARTRSERHGTVEQLLLVQRLDDGRYSVNGGTLSDVVVGATYDVHPPGRRGEESLGRVRIESVELHQAFARPSSAEGEPELELPRLEPHPLSLSQRPVGSYDLTVCPLDLDVVTGVGNLGLVAEKQPGSAEYAALLQFIDRGIRPATTAHP